MRKSELRPCGVCGVCVLLVVWCYNRPSVALKKRPSVVCTHMPILFIMPNTPQHATHCTHVTRGIHTTHCTHATHCTLDTSYILHTCHAMRTWPHMPHMSKRLKERHILHRKPITRTVLILRATMQVQCSLSVCVTCACMLVYSRVCRGVCCARACCQEA